MKMHGVEYKAFRVEMFVDREPFKARADVAKALNLIAFDIEASLKLEGLVRDADGEPVGQWTFLQEEGDDGP